jgi:hypothetical protein
VALQRVQVTTILHHQAVMATDEASSRLGVFPRFVFLAISLHNLLHATGGDGFRP